jgi:hypothetical protein
MTGKKKKEKNENNTRDIPRERRKKVRDPTGLALG